MPDVAIVAVPAGRGAAVEELAARGYGAAIVFTAGFAEMDAAGAVAQERMLAAARAHGMRLLGPNCLGLFNTAQRLLRHLQRELRDRLADRRAGSASPASPAPTARTSSAWRATGSSARRLRHDRQRGRRDDRRRASNGWRRTPTST